MRGCVRALGTSAALAAMLTVSCKPRSGAEPSRDGGADRDAGKPGGKTASSYLLTAEAAMDPESCKLCHAKHHAEWERSMHAYASVDPVFLAMNRRGQRETGGKLGKFCVNCHAPMAVRAGKTSDGLNLEKLPKALQGVTCYFCHSVESLGASHANNPLELAGDGVMRGGIAEPMETRAHDSKYSVLLDRDRRESADLCGTCHDIVNDHGTHIERTFEEWKASVFAQPVVGTTCGQCHMDRSTELERTAEVPRAPLRRRHDHSFPAVDHATGELGRTASAKEQVAANQAFLNKTLQSALCVTGIPGAGGANVLVVLDNVGGGHSFPSGSAQDRRLWVELTAYAGDRPIFSSGVLKDPLEPVTALLRTDPNLWLMRDTMLDANGHETHDFWEAGCYESELLPAQVTFSRQDPRFYESHVVRRYPQQATLKAYPERVTLRVRLSPIGQDVLADLIETGDLDRASAAEHSHIYDVGRRLEWTAEAASEKFVDRMGLPVSCVSDTALRGGASNTVLERKTTCKPQNPTNTEKRKL